MGLPDGYEVINVTGPNATHTLTDGAGWQQKYHPLENWRRNGQDAGTVAGVARSKVKSRPKPPKALKVEWPVIAKVSTRAKRRMCANGHYHWGTECMSCLPERRCPSPCGRQIRSRFRTICARCAEGRRVPANRAIA